MTPRRATSRVTAAARGRDGAERLLALATTGLPPRRAEWGAALRAELAAIADTDADARWRFARSASMVAFRQGLGIRLAVPLAAGLVTAAAALTASRVQLPDGGPGVMAVTVPVPAVLLLAVALVAAGTTRSFRIGLQAGGLALVACFAAVSAVVAAEGLVWMERRGVFVLDGDPPRHTVGSLDVVLDFFSTGLWLGHLVFWLPWPLIGAAVATWTGGRIDARRESAAAGRADR